MKKNLCIIPVRGGSKGIPRKNLRNIYRKITLLEWTINQAKEVFSKEDIIISTEDSEMKEVAQSCNVRVIDRPKYLAKDNSKTISVIDHLFKVFEKENINFNTFTILQVTSPLRLITNIKDAIKLINNYNYDSVISVYEDSKHPAKTYFIKKGNLEPVLPKYEYLQRQKLPKVVRRNGAIFSVNKDFYIQNKKLWGGRMGFILMSKERSIDIDTFDDLNKARLFLENIK